MFASQWSLQDKDLWVWDTRVIERFAHAGRNDARIAAGARPLALEAEAE
jgi:hypothetical protein